MIRRLLRSVRNTRFWPLLVPGSLWLLLTALPLVFLAQNIWEHPKILLALILTLFSAGVLVLVLIGREFLRQYYGRIVLAIFTLYVLASLSSYVTTNSSTTNNSATNSSSSSDTRVQFRLINPQTPGTIFILALAVITILGFTITIARLQEAHVRIDSYERFLSRLALMLNEVIEDVDPPFYKRWWRKFDPLPKIQPTLKVLCSVPTLGNLTHHDEFLARVYPLWMHIASNKDIRVDMYCLRLYSSEENVNLPNYLPPESPKVGFGSIYHPESEFVWGSGKPEVVKRNENRENLRKTTDVGKFYTEMAMKRGYDLRDPAVLRGVTQAVEIISKLSIKELNNFAKGYEWGEERLPPFHIFLSDHRVIVAVPLDRTVIATSATTGEVSMIGYETTDSRVMRRLREVFKERTDDVEPESFAVRSASDEVNSEKSVQTVMSGQDSVASEVGEARSGGPTSSDDHREEAKNAQA